MVDLPSTDADIRRRSLAFNRRPGSRHNRGRISTSHGGSAAPPVDDILTVGGDPLTDGGVELKNG
jgi:hypothetical protein